MGLVTDYLPWIDFDLKIPGITAMSPSFLQRSLLCILLLATLLPPHYTLAQDHTRVVQVGVFQLHPMVFLDEQGQAQGFYVDLLNEIASREGWQVEYVPGTWAEGLQRTREGTLDLMTIIIKNPERDRYLDFCQEEVMMVWGQVFAPRDTWIQSILDLDGQSVGIMKDDLNGQNFQETAHRFGIDCHIVEADTHQEVFQLVAQGAVAAGVAPNLFGFPHAHQYGLVQTPILFSPNSTTFAAPEGRNQDLLAAIDRNLKQWKADQDSYYYRTLDRWVNSSGQDSSSLSRWLIIGLVVGFGLTILLLLWNRTLNLQVIAHTRELDASEKKIRAIFDQTFLFIGLLDTQGNLTEVNHTAVEFAGVSLEEVLGKPFWEGPWWNHDPLLQDQVRTGIKKALTGTIHYGEAVHIDKHGLPHSIEYTIKPVFDDQGQVVMLIPEGHDVTERERLANDLRQSQKIEAIGTLAGGIAHDFNNILTAISGFNELALEDAKGQPIIEDSLREVSAATERARNLVQQILTFSRRKESDKSVFDPNLVVNEAIKLLRSSLPSTISIAPQLSATRKIVADPTQIHQVVMNLGTNAFHAMEATGGCLKIGLKDVMVREAMPARGGVIPPDDYVVLEVFDNGIGMDPVMIDKIFEPYFTSKESGKGTGLGLSVVHGIVQSSQGFIQVESEPGQGTTFLVYLPATEKHPTAPSEESEVTPRLAGKECILFVEDEVTLTSLASRYFGSLGYDIRVFADSPAAWQHFAEDPQGFDILITDQTMPQMTGLELIRRVRDLRRDIPIIICTGYNSGISPEDCRELSIAQLLHKPMLMQALAREVRKILGHQDAYLS